MNVGKFNLFDLKNQLTEDIKMAKSKSALSYLLTALAYIAIGVLLIIKQAALIMWIMIVAGALFILQGLFDIIKNKETLTGLVKIIIGTALILCGVIPALSAYALIALGALLILNAILTFFSSPKNIFSIIAFVLTIVVGLALAAPQLFGFSIPWVFYVIGVILIINGLVLLFGKKK